MSNTQLLRHTASGQIFADPSDNNFTVAFKQSTQRKSVDGLAFNNNIAEIVVNDLHDVTVGGKTVTDTLSVRVRVSGGEVSNARLCQIVKSLASQLPTWCDENVLAGFEPATVPINPS